ncbi:hypothetical protein [Tenacibaculum sp. 190524A02b]|uniref:hypothetical protein n=1 Tax=Tenacibaculum vairaonense TaxID=3137860 RepID=UPI0031FB42FE
MKLVPIWEEKVMFEVEKQESFRYKERASKEFSRKYVVELARDKDRSFEIYYPKSILNPIKLLDELNSFDFSEIDVLTKTLFYEVDENYTFDKVLNKKEVIESLNNDFNLLQKYVDEEEKEELSSIQSIICESESKFQKYVLEDVIAIHFNYGMTIEPGYYFSFHKESIRKKIVKKVFPKSRFVLTDKHWMRHSEYGNFIKIEYLKGMENITSGYKPNWNEIEEAFGEGEFEVKNHPNLTLVYEVYQYNKENRLLEVYDKEHVIDSPVMRKEITHKIKRVKNVN